MNKEQLIQLAKCKLYTKSIQHDSANVTVVMDAGYGDDSTAWNPLVEDVSKLANVFLYDRAGLGKSETSASPRTSRNMIQELRQLLTETNTKPPYFLVGHSFGGVNMQLFADAYEEDVSGLILVDVTPKDYRERFLPTMSQDFQRAYYQQFVREGNYEEFMESLKQLKETELALQTPVIVIAAGKKDHYSSESQRLWNDMQKELTQISSNSEFVLAEASAHYIQRDEPEVILAAIKRLIERFK
ncbi:alpha/beta fold hydrolase [Exiguobacterium aurantiacum]|uniref:alpha/beta fold hydrolase n=1 Tax=Exiguobacterium aurantiacum TaxID=33987 RepID=UPI00384BBDF0